MAPFIYLLQNERYFLYRCVSRCRCISDSSSKRLLKQIENVLCSVPLYCLLTIIDAIITLLPCNDLFYLLNAELLHLLLVYGDLTPVSNVRKLRVFFPINPLAPAFLLSIPPIHYHFYRRFSDSS